MALQDDINLFVSRANTKIGEYTDIVEPLLRAGDQSDNEIKKSVELIDLIETLTHVNCPWSDDDIIYWMNFMTLRHELQDIVYQDYDPYVIPTIVIVNNGVGITLEQLLAALIPYTNKDNLLQAEIDALEILVAALLPPTLVADVAALTIVVNGHTTSIGTLTTNLNGLAADLADHILDTDVHIQAGERVAWNAKVTQAELTAALATKAASSHTHSIAQVTSLQAELDALQEQIDDLPAPVDGFTPDIQIGTVVEGSAPAVALDPGSTPEIPILNFTLKSGDPFRVDMMGTLAGRSTYDNESAGYTYMDSVTGEVYFRIGTEVGTWSLPVQFRGWDGWTPIYGYVVVDENTVVKQFIEFVGGTGTAPDLEALYAQPPATIFYAGATGFVWDINLATNVRGTRGDRFKIDLQGSDRSVADAELKGYTFLNTTTGKVSFKLSDTSGDWSAEFAWSAVFIEGINYFTGQAYAVWSGTGLIFDVLYPTYYLQGVLYPAGVTQITLDAADVTNPRLDVIGVDATGAIKITGVAAVDPAQPTVDTITQLAITTVLINAGAVVPSEITDEDVYKENTEWTGSSNNGTVDFNAVATPFLGTKHVDCGSFINGQYIKFVDGSPHNATDYAVLKFYVNLKAVFVAAAGFIVRFYNGATLVSTPVTVTNGLFNFNRTTINAYQLVTIPIPSFSFSSGIFDTIHIELKNQNITGFRLDNIVLQTGEAPASALQNTLGAIQGDSGTASVTTPNDTFILKGGRGTNVSAVGKTITINQTDSDKSYEVVTLAAHGFTVGECLKKGATITAWSVIDGTVDSQDVFRGVVSEVIDVNNFVVAFPGSRITALSGLTAGSVHYAQADGSLGTTPTDVKVLTADSAATGYLLASANGGGGGGGHAIQYEGTPIAVQPNLNVLNGLTAVDDGPNSATLFKLGGVFSEEVVFSGAFGMTFGDAMNPMTGITAFFNGLSYWDLGTDGQLGIVNIFDDAVEAGGALFITTSGAELTSGVNSIRVNKGVGGITLTSPSGLFENYVGNDATDLIWFKLISGATPTFRVDVGASVTTFAGIEYEDDFSANFSVNSLINLGFADARYAAITPTIVTSNITGAVSIDLSTGSKFLLTLTGNVTSFTFTNEVVGREYVFVFIKGTTEYTLAWTAAKYRFPFGNAPVLTDPTTNGTSGPTYSRDIVTALCSTAGRLDIVITPDLINN